MSAQELSAAERARRLLATLQDPSRALPTFGQVHDQASGKFVKYDPSRITHTFQSAVLDYFSNPPRTPHGETKWLTLMTARQMGKSLTVEYAAYCKAAYTPGWDHVCIADTRERAEYLHKRIHHLHHRWPEQLRAKTVPNRESRQLTFSPLQGGKMRILSAETGAVGVGQSPDSFHASEVHLWSDFDGSMFLINPSLMNRSHALVLFEATPWERNCAWHSHYLNATRGAGRHIAQCFPYWDGKLNRRPWDKDWSLENGEVDLLNRYGPLGLSKDNLAFRRLMLDSDPEIRRNPEMFQVMYPFDDLTCWVAATSSAIPEHVLEKHLQSALQPWVGPYQEYEAPEPGAIYAIGVDPSGYAARDHASFQVLKCWRGEWTQVAVFADHIDPVSFTTHIIRAGKRYNSALVVVESNGVGQAVLSLMDSDGYPNLYYEKKFRPGFTASSKSVDEATGWMVDGLLDELILHDKDTVEQLQTYRNDKRIEENPSSEIARGAASSRRRARHHWDKISALMMAIVGARRVPTRGKPTEPGQEGDDNIVAFTGMGYADQQKYLKEAKEARKEGSQGRRRVSYRSVRRRR